jgi:hypothetical protein
VNDLGEAERAKLFERFGRSLEPGASICSESDPADLRQLHDLLGMKEEVRGGLV